MNVQEQITALATKTPSELAATFAELFGHAPRRRHPDYLRKRIGHKLQTNAYGGLSRVARAALDRLVAETQLPAIATTAPVATAQPTNGTLRPGSVLQRVWRGQTVRVLVTADGFEWDGRTFSSLSAVAHAITNAKWSGRFFFGLTKRSAKR